MAAKLCLALDSRNEKTAERLADVTAEHVDILKIGLTTFTAFGPRVVERLAGVRPVFLDLKLHDIPAQVAGAVEAVAATGASFATVHASGGQAMLESAAEASPDSLTLLAVTVLTSLDDADLAAIGSADAADKAVLRLADLALRSGVPGLVCSPKEVGDLRTRYGARPDGPVLVVPGIRPRESAADDQRRTLTPGEAARAGADILVVGRPITGASDPAAAARAIKEEIGERS